MDDIVGYAQLTANLSTLAVVGWIYAAYVKNLRVINAAKEAQVAVLETNLRMLRDRADELERRTPDHVEKVLAERIQIREEELLRLREDRGRHANEIQSLNAELATLKTERDKMKSIIEQVKAIASEPPRHVWKRPGNR